MGVAVDVSEWEEEGWMPEACARGWHACPADRERRDGERRARVPGRKGRR